MAEFALVAPIFLLLLFSVIQLGLVFGAHNGLVDGVRSAARRAATYRINEQSFNATVFPYSVTGSICNTVRTELIDRLRGAQGQELLVGFKPANLAPTIAYEWEQNPESGQYFLVAHVAATYKNPLYVPLVSFFLDSSDANPGDGFLTLSASEDMRVENPPLDTPGSLSTQTCT
jgi:Flp pilus assembly protein TadG